MICSVLLVQVAHRDVSLSHLDTLKASLNAGIKPVVVVVVRGQSRSRVVPGADGSEGTHAGVKAASDDEGALKQGAQLVVGASQPGFMTCQRLGDAIGGESRLGETGLVEGDGKMAMDDRFGLLHGSSLGWGAVVVVEAASVVVMTA
ncbi:hypothetical protein L249_7293 [Ophiocordyceps polyrhachis-furcata BCC 54312]|uniref:Uncharacterized protein n=1 Tax=Ophiocordyceps polyrhachis-furcata BCC 54312 TaxID=1330021 RepID=A0A367LAP3_9HYPO|nr:hypothetical protein L249_7293 [Ophiocordyceps polyrhachis-furcata BCC 54312]